MAATIRKRKGENLWDKFKVYLKGSIYLFVKLSDQTSYSCFPKRKENEKLKSLTIPSNIAAIIKIQNEIWKVWGNSTSN